MASSPFSINKIMGVCVLIVIMLAFLLPMIGYAFAPVGGTPSSNVICGGAYNAILEPNVSSVYYNASCVSQNLFGVNYSSNRESSLGAVFSIVNSTAFPSNTASSSNSVTSGGIGCVGGFSSPILQFTGLAFVFCGIGTIAATVQQLGNVFSLAIGTWLTWLPVPEGIAVGFILKILIGYIACRVLLQMVASWMKYNFADS